MKATTATYSIDGGNPTPFTLDGSGASSPGVLYNQIFFTTGQLSSGSHTLTVVYQGNSDSTPLALYTLVVQNGPGGSTSGGSGSGTTGGGTGPNPATTAGSGLGGITSANSGKTSTITTVNPGTIDPASTTVMSLPGISAAQDRTTIISSAIQSPGVASSSGTTSQVSSTNIGPIIGGVIGGVALILIAIFGFLLLRRRSKRDFNFDNVIEPFNQNQQMTSYQPSTHPSDPFSDQPIRPLSQTPLPGPSKRAMLDAQFERPNTDPTHARTTSGASLEQTTSTSRNGENSSISYTQNSSLRNFGSLHDASTLPSSLSTSNPLSSPSSPGVVVAVDEDSGIRFRRTLQDGQMVQILPPVYSVS